jgi:hypothetical protein
MKSVRLVCVFLYLTAAVQGQAPRLSSSAGAQPDAKTQAKIVEGYGRLPLSFEANQGQTDARVKFLSRGKATASVSGTASSSGLNFAPAVVYGSGGYSGQSVAVADVNGDGKPDLLVANRCVSSSNCTNGSVGVLLGNGDGTFKSAVTYNSGGQDATSVAVADLNGDGKLDIVVANSCESSCSVPVPGTVGVLLGNGDGTFQAAVTYSTGGFGANSVAVADVNGDGKLDLIVATVCSSNDGFSCSNIDSFGGVSVLLGNGDGTFRVAVIYDSGGYLAESVAVEDVNGDGKPDLVVANQCTVHCSSNGWVGVLLGNGDGTFQSAMTYSPDDIVVSSIAAADVNGDGKPDIVVAGGSNVGVLLGNGDGTFQTVVPYGSGGYPAVSVAIEDVNGDSNPDLIAANNCVSSSNCTTGTVGVLLGNGDGTFQAAMAYGSGSYRPQFVTVSDVNGDGKPDDSASAKQLQIVSNLTASSHCGSFLPSYVLIENEGNCLMVLAMSWKWARLIRAFICRFLLAPLHV